VLSDTCNSETVQVESKCVGRQTSFKLRQLRGHLETETQAIIYVVNPSQDSFDIVTTDQVDIQTGTDSQQTVTDIVQQTIKYCTETI